MAALSVGQGEEGQLPEERWASVREVELEVVVAQRHLELACSQFRRQVPFLHHVLSVAFADLPTSKSALKAMKRRQVFVNGNMASEHDSPAPKVGDVLRALVGGVEAPPADVRLRLTKWNERSMRPEAKLRVLAMDEAAGWAVVNKPAGMHCSPCEFNAALLTFEAYLPALVPPPTEAMPGRGVKVCHRLDFRVCGPVVVASSQEMMRRIKRLFEERRVAKEYRAIICGKIGEVGTKLVVAEPLDGMAAESRVEVLQVVPCPHFGHLTEVALHPVTGRHQQLRRHCAEGLGAPIVNDEPAMFEKASQAWFQREQRPMPKALRRGGGQLFLQAVHIQLPATKTTASRDSAASGESSRTTLPLPVHSTSTSASAAAATATGAASNAGVAATTAAAEEGDDASRHDQGEQEQCEGCEDQGHEGGTLLNINVRVEVAARFPRLLATSTRAYQNGWRSDVEGRTYCVEENSESGEDDPEASEGDEALAQDKLV